MTVRGAIFLLCSMAVGLVAGWSLRGGDGGDSPSVTASRSPIQDAGVPPPLLGGPSGDLDGLRAEIRRLREDLESGRLAPSAAALEAMDARLGEKVRQVLAEDRLRSERRAALEHVDLLVSGSEDQLSQLRMMNATRTLIQEVEERLEALRTQKRRIEEAGSLDVLRQAAGAFPLEHGLEQD